MKYMLDTNILSALEKAPDGDISRKMVSVGIDNVATSIVCAGELRFGAAKSNSISLKRNIEAILSSIIILNFEVPADVSYANIRSKLEKQGTPIGANDMWIAAHALSLDLTLVTDNVSEFARIDGLKIENWLRD
jgi:tRNA(fMet)-specific endonuclease VapC